MLSKKKSQIFFLFGCIPMRLLLAFIPLYFKNKYIINTLKIFLIMISFSFLYLYFTNSRFNAIEAGGKTWWHNMRIIHAILYLFAFYYLNQNNNKLSSKILLYDLTFGLFLFTNLRII